MTPPGSHVLVARQDNAGDVLLCGPAVRAAATAGRVTFLAGPKGADAARLLPGVAQVLVYDAPWVGDDAPSVDAADVEGLVERLRRLRLDAALVLTSFHQSSLPLALVLRMAGVPRIAATSEDHPGSLLDHRLPYVPELHEVDAALAVAAALGFAPPDGDDGRLAVTLPGDAAPPPGAPAGPYVVLHPGASVPARAVPAGLAAAAAAELADRGWQVALTGGPGEQALVAEVARLAGHLPAVHALAGTLDLAGLARLLEGAQALVVGNTGPAHLAAAVGTPVVALFAPVVDPRRWRPHGVPAVLLGDLGIACAGCRARRCPFPGQPCIAGVGPGDVADAVAQLARPRPAPTQEVTA